MKRQAYTGGEDIYGSKDIYGTNGLNCFFFFFYINVMFCYYKNLPRIRGCASDKRLCLGFKGLREGMIIRSRMQ